MTDSLTVNIKVEGLKDLEAEMKQIAKEAPEELDVLLLDASLKTQELSIESIQKGAKTGRVYKRGKGVFHQASAAGQAPASDTGNLVQNITIRKNKKLDYDVGSRKGASYGVDLEFGTRHMGARPWLRPASTKAIKELGEALKKVKLKK